MARNNAPSGQSVVTAAERERQRRRILTALRLGATTFAMLAGVACYIALDQFTPIGMIPAFVIGLVFALLTRTAAASLARDWLMRSANRAQREISPGERDDTIH
ncbi:MAG TPA: hypothetical protein VFN11_10230 [Ktedonobacterales bacterium]|nr:hypothetical protein [Ktedonobacterales bacterium]